MFLLQVKKWMELYLAHRFSQVKVILYLKNWFPKLDLGLYTLTTSPEQFEDVFVKVRN